MGELRFGPARVPSRESPEAAIELLQARGHTACEIDFEGKFWMDYPWAERFGELARAAGIQGSCRSMAGVALSAAVATELEGLGWRRVLVADAPTEVAILKTLEDLEVEVRRSGALNP